MCVAWVTHKGCTVGGAEAMTRKGGDWHPRPCIIPHAKRKRNDQRLEVVGLSRLTQRRWRSSCCYDRVSHPAPNATAIARNALAPALIS